MPVLINEVVTEFEPQTRESSASAPATPASAPTGSIDMSELAEAQSLQRARQQRLEVD